MAIRTIVTAIFTCQAALAFNEVNHGRTVGAEALIRSHQPREGRLGARAHSNDHAVLAASSDRAILATTGAEHVGDAAVKTTEKKQLPPQQAALAGVWLAYPAVAVLVGAIVIFLYWPRGPRVICSVLAYLIFLSSMKLTVKYIFVEYAFNYPKFVCMTHFLMGYLAAVAILMQRSVQDPSGIFASMTIPKLREFCFEIFPISIGFATAIAANNMALVFSSAAFTEIVGCTTPIFSVMAMVAKGMPVDKWTLVPVALVIAGCTVSVTGEVHFSAAGMALCCLANGGRAVKGVLQQLIMSGKGKAAMDPVNLLAWMCLPSAILMGIWSALSEGMAPITILTSSLYRNQIAKWIFISAVNATALNLSQIYVTKEIGVVGSQLTAQSKSVLTMLGAVMLFNEVVTPVEWAGFVVVLLGVYIHTRWESQAKAALEDEQAKQKQQQYS